METKFYVSYENGSKNDKEEIYDYFDEAYENAKKYINTEYKKLKKYWKGTIIADIRLKDTKNKKLYFITRVFKYTY